MINIIMFIIVMSTVCIVLIDIIPILSTWLSRIKIGRYTDSEIWNDSISKKGLKWLNNAPKIKVTDNTRLVVIDMIRGNYSKSDIQHWQEAALLLGLGEKLKHNKNREIEIEIEKFLKSKINEEGKWINKPKNVDGAILAYSIMKLENVDIDKYKPAFDYIFELIKENIGSDGTVQYRNFMKSYRYVDTIGFICPFLVCYGNKYNKQECIDLAINQIKIYEKYGMIGNYNIPYHVYKIENKIPLGLYGWGRGLGWYAIGLIDTWNELKDDDKYKKILEDSVIKFAKSAIELQQSNGAWSWTVTRPETRLDSSTTATLSWFMLNASNIASISDECMNSYNKAINYLMSITRRNGSIDFSQGDTKDIGVYSQLFDILPFTQGFSIRVINKNN